MAGSCTVTDYTAFALKKVKFEWTADAVGNVTVGTSAADYFGKVLTLVTIPGTPAAQDNYDITIKDADGYDVLQGNGSNLGNSTIQYRALGLSSAVFGNLTLNVSAAGNATQGTAILYIDPLR